MTDNFPPLQSDGSIDYPGFVTYRGYSREMALASVGKGWASLVDMVFDALDKSTAPIKVVQVKEKYGTLRVYTDYSGIPSIDDAIEEAERLSHITCEACGKEGTLREGGWWQTLCDECDEPRKK